MGELHIPCLPFTLAILNHPNSSIYISKDSYYVSLFIPHLFRIPNQIILYFAKNRAASPLFICLARILNPITNNNNGNTNINNIISMPNYSIEQPTRCFSTFIINSLRIRSFNHAPFVNKPILTQIERNTYLYHVNNIVSPLFHLNFMPHTPPYDSATKTIRYLGRNLRIIPGLGQNLIWKGWEKFSEFWSVFGCVWSKMRGFTPSYKVLDSAQNRPEILQRDRAAFWRVRAVLMPLLLRVRAPSWRVRAEPFFCLDLCSVKWS